MFLSQYFLPTLRETPASAELASHQLMLKAGLIRKLASGLYTWLPFGLRVLRRVEQVVREEMNAAGAHETAMPMIQPAELWQETERWQQFGPQLLKMQDRHQRAFCFGPTHEEVITDLMRNEVQSYKQLPLNLFQITTKFRDEIRPRFGVMRAREFIMKDAYSFHADTSSLAEGYQTMHDAYSRIFTRLGLKFRAVDADSGSIGGSASQEFHVLADSGEDVIAYSDQSDYAANLEKAAALDPGTTLPATGADMQRVDTPDSKTIADVIQTLDLPIEQSIKTLLVKGSDTPLVALILRGDHTLNPLKAEKLAQVASPLTWASEADILAAVGCEPGSIGPVGLELPMIIDRDAAIVGDFCCGANQDGVHLINVNWQRDIDLSEIADLREVVEGDASPDGQGTLKFARGIEVGHIFQLGDKYSQAMDATALDEHGKSFPIQMGCYGIGVSRIVAAAIEQNHDDAGIIWPAELAPFDVHLIPLNMAKSELVSQTCRQLKDQLEAAGYSVLCDDRRLRPGEMFADADLIGIPRQIIIGERSLANQQVECCHRRDKAKQLIAVDAVVDWLDNEI